MYFRVLSHAGLEVTSRDQSLLIDPWLIGSTYWRSWWNYPPVDEKLVADLQPTFIYLTHVHWDHFAGPSLRLFPKNIPILIPKEPVGRMYRDLLSMGYKNVIELEDGQAFKLAEDFHLFSYHFSPFTDSAVVVEVDGVTLFDANDAKLMGLPLKRILRRHTPDFTFRSHSSANSRACYRFISQQQIESILTSLDFDAGEALSTSTHRDDKEKYIQDFTDFCRSVGTGYYIPFASNQCYLHPRTYSYNQFSCTPQDVVNHFKTFEVDLLPQLRVMVSGDTYDSQTNKFQIRSSEWFSNREACLDRLRQEKSISIAKRLEEENKARFELARYAKYFASLAKLIPWPLSKLFQKPVIYVLQTKSKNYPLLVDFAQGKCSLIDKPSSLGKVKPQVIMYVPLLVFNDCIRQKLFSHLAISKLITYVVSPESASYSRRLSLLFNVHEYGYLPIWETLSLRFIMTWVRRWRELLLYVVIISKQLLGKKFRYSDFL
jgi:UDP-MurNAc hydroxylase